MRRASIAAIILAAGESKRMRRPKQLIKWHGRALIEHVTQQAVDAALKPVVVVTGHRADEVRAALNHPLATVVHNPDWPEGMSTSVRSGVAVLTSDIDAAVFLLIDQPRVDAAHIKAMITMYHNSGKPIIVSSYKGRRSSPTLFDRSFFEQLMHASGDSGGRAIIKANPESVASVEAANESTLVDIDTPETLRRELESESE